MSNDDLEATVEELESRLDEAEAMLEAFNRARTTLLEENEQLRDRVAELERVVEPDPGATEYEQLTFAQKVHQVRKKLVETAARTNGKASLKYKGVMVLFDGHPSSGHCYNMMRRAAQLDGFAYGPGPDGEKRLRVELADVSDDSLVHSVKEDLPAGAV